jgi:hypothetical protein
MSWIRWVHPHHLFGAATGVLALGAALALATPAFAQSGPTSSRPLQPMQACIQSLGPGQLNLQCPQDQVNRPFNPARSNPAMQQARQAPSAPSALTGPPVQMNPLNQPVSPSLSQQPGPSHQRQDQQNRPMQMPPPMMQQPQPGRIHRIGLDRDRFRPGEPIRFRFLDQDDLSLFVNQFSCTQVELEILTPGGWQPFADLGQSCSLFGFAAFNAEQTAVLPANLPAGTYRVATSVTTTNGLLNQVFYSDPFTLF